MDTTVGVAAAAATDGVGGLLGGALRAMSAVRKLIRAADDLPSFRVTSAAGEPAKNLRREANVNGTTYKINTGHGFNRPHKGGGDLQTTTLTPDQVESAIIKDIEGYRSSGGGLPQAGFGKPAERTIDVNGYSITYRAMQNGASTVQVPTYWLNP